MRISANQISSIISSKAYKRSYVENIERKRKERKLIKRINHCVVGVHTIGLKFGGVLPSKDI